MAAPEPLLVRLIKLGHEVALIRGRLEITPKDGKSVPPEWLAKNRTPLIVEAAGKTGALALEYLGYSTGGYGTKHFSGVTLQFCCLASGESYYAIFNASTKRSRNTKTGKAGSPLPNGQFRVEKKSAFMRFWETTGLPHRRLSDFHDYMGNLQGIVFTATITIGKDSRLDKSSLRPLSITSERLAALTHPDNFPTSARQVPDNFPTTIPDKETPQSQQASCFRADLATGQNCYGNTVIRDHGNKGAFLPPHEQPIEDWLDDYEQAQPL